ncbi:MAG: AAA family ATPase [Paracoccaceae bacterium]
MRKVVITGCSGGGKSTLLAELERRGHAVVAEPGRRVIAAERAQGGTGFPWDDARRFADLAFWMAVGDHATATAALTFFDRSALDQAAWYARAGLVPPDTMPDYHPTVFLAPPWQELFHQDADRRHDFETAQQEYNDLCDRLPGWGYTCHVLPETTVSARADFVLATLASEVTA